MYDAAKEQPKLNLNGIFWVECIFVVPIECHPCIYNSLFHHNLVFFPMLVGHYVVPGATHRYLSSNRNMCDDGCMLNSGAGSNSTLLLISSENIFFENAFVVVLTWSTP